MPGAKKGGRILVWVSVYGQAGFAGSLIRGLVGTSQMQQPLVEPAVSLSHCFFLPDRTE